MGGCSHFCQNLEVSRTMVRGLRPLSIHGVYGGGLLVSVLSGVGEYFLNGTSASLIKSVMF